MDLSFFTQWHFWITLLSIIPCFFRINIGAAIFFNVKFKTNKKQIIFIFSVSFVLSVLKYLTDSSAWMTLISAIVIFTYVCLAFNENNLKDKIKFFGAYYLFTILLDMTALYFPFFIKVRTVETVSINGITFEIVAYCLLGVFWLMKKYLLPRFKLIEGNHIKILFIISTFGYVVSGSIVTLIFIYNAPTDERLYTINATLFPSSFALTLLLFVNIYYIKMLNKTLDENKQYQENIEGLYETTRIFRHEYKNAMTVLMGYAQEAGNEKMISFLKQYTDEASFKDSVYIKSVSDISDAGLKNLVISKLLESKEKSIKVTFMLEDKLDKTGTSMKTYTEILSILFDNAIQACEGIQMPYIDIILGNDVIHVVNSVKEKVDSNRIFERGYTTKEGHSGLGMYRLSQIFRRNENMNYSLKSDDKSFEFKVTL